MWQFNFGIVKNFAIVWEKAHNNNCNRVQKCILHKFIMSTKETVERERERDQGYIICTESWDEHVEVSGLQVRPRSRTYSIAGRSGTGHAVCKVGSTPDHVPGDPYSAPHSVGGGGGHHPTPPPGPRCTFCRAGVVVYVSDTSCLRCHISNCEGCGGRVWKMTFYLLQHYQRPYNETIMVFGTALAWFCNEYCT